MWLPLFGSHSCCILGDSIAVGAHSVNKQCSAVAKVGISTKTFNKKYLRDIPLSNTYIISLGSNDSKNLKRDLNNLRNSLKSDSEVIWIVPHINSKIVEEVAVEHKDEMFHFTTGKDGVHPKSYKAFKNITQYNLQISKP